MTYPNAQIYDPVTPPNYELGISSDSLLRNGAISRTAFSLRERRFPSLLCCHAYILCEIHEVCFEWWKVKWLDWEERCQAWVYEPGGKRMTPVAPWWWAHRLPGSLVPRWRPFLPGSTPGLHRGLGKGDSTLVGVFSKRSHCWRTRSSQTLTPSVVEHRWCLLNPKSTGWYRDCLLAAFHEQY